MVNYNSISDKDSFNEVPPLLDFAQLSCQFGFDRSSWLDRYIQFSKKWSPLAYDGFHEAVGLWVLSTAAARRIAVHLGKPRFSNLYISLVARTSFHAKTTTAEIGLQVIRDAGLSWLLAPDDASPQKFMALMANKQIPEKFTSNGEDLEWWKLKVAFSSQRGWYYEEFGQKIQAMMKDGGFMSDFRGMLRRLDDTPPSYEYGTISRGIDFVRQPYLALLASLTPDDLRGFANRGSALWGDGFLARFALVSPTASNNGRARFPTGKRIIPAEILRALNEWHSRLGMPEIKIIEKDGVKTVQVPPIEPIYLGIDQDVEDAFYNYHYGLREILEDRDNHDLDGNYTRLAEKAIRIAMLLASVEGKESIQMKHWVRAQQITEGWRKDLHSLYHEVNQNLPSKEKMAEEQVIAILQKLGQATAAQVARYSRNLSSNEADRILLSLVNLGLVEISERTQKRTNRYTLVNLS